MTELTGLTRAMCEIGAWTGAWWTVRLILWLDKPRKGAGQ